MKSKEFRSDPAFLRNQYELTPYGMPIITRQGLCHIDGMLSFHDMRKNDQDASKYSYLIHFFKNDPCFNSLYDHPDSERNHQKIETLAQYAAVCSPDFSVYPEMPIPRQQAQIFRSRWCGAHWQSMGLQVFPTVTWADQPSYSFCFDGITPHSTVVVSTLGCHQSKSNFLAGYDKMLETIHPDHVLCYGNPFREMDGDVICFPYHAFRAKG